MPRESALAAISGLSAANLGVFRGKEAVKLGVSRDQLCRLAGLGVIARELPDTYRLTGAPRSREQQLRAALLWAGPEAAAAGVSAGEVYGTAGVRAEQPEIIVPRNNSARSDKVRVHHAVDLRAAMIRTFRGVRVTGVEATLVSLAHALEPEQFEIACEDARRRRLTTVPALRAYTERHGGRAGVAAMRGLLDELDPRHPARSTLEVKTRRLLVAHGITGFVREFPLAWHGRTYRYDFAFESARTILETNGRRWHDDAADYEHDHEKWSIPGRLGYRIVFATWDKVAERPDRLLRELTTTLAAPIVHRCCGSRFSRR